MKHLPGSMHGEGIGGTVQEVADPNKPSYDRAEKVSGTDRKIAELMREPNMSKLSGWELLFLGNIYGAEKVTKAQHIRVAKIHKKIVG